MVTITTFTDRSERYGVVMFIAERIVNGRARRAIGWTAESALANLTKKQPLKTGELVEVRYA